MPELGKAVVIMGLALTLLGALLWAGGPWRIGRLPGDLFFQKGNFTFAFPIVTCILLSLLLTAISWFFRR
jgi:hypothetical protein